MRPSFNDAFDRRAKLVNGLVGGGGDLHADRHGQAELLDPRAWLASVLRRIADHPTSRLDELLPWNCSEQAAVKLAA